MNDLTLMKEELIIVNGEKHLVYYTKSHPLHTFVKAGSHCGVPCYKGYLYYENEKKQLTGYYVIDIIDRSVRLFQHFKRKKLHLISKPSSINWNEWMEINIKIGKLKYNSKHNINY